MLIGALGLTGVFVLGAILLAVVFAGLLFWWRYRFGGKPDTPEDIHIV